MFKETPLHDASRNGHYKASLVMLLGLLGLLRYTDFLTEPTSLRKDLKTLSTFYQMIYKFYIYTSPVAFLCYLTTNYFIIIIRSKTTFGARYVEYLSI